MTALFSGLDGGTLLAIVVAALFIGFLLHIASDLERLRAEQFGTRRRHP